jgi:hypothetical protein
VLWPGCSAVVFWLEHVSETTRLLERVVHDGGLLGKHIEVSRGSDLGYPRAARAEDGALIDLLNEVTTSLKLLFVDCRLRLWPGTRQSRCTKDGQNSRKHKNQRLPY